MRLPVIRPMHSPPISFYYGGMFQKNQDVCVLTGCYYDVLVIDEYSRNVYAKTPRAQLEGTSR